jgi:MFS family permease
MNEGEKTRAGWRVLWRAGAAQLASVLGEHVFLWTALPIWVYDGTGSASSVALALGVVTAPALVSLPAGAWTSRYATRPVLLGCGALRLALVVLLLFAREPLLPFRLALPAALGIAFLVSLVDSFFMPALLAALPEWLPEEQLLRANSFLEATDVPAQLFGPPLAVLLYERGGLTGAVAAQALAYGTGLALLAATPFPGASGRAAEALGARLRRTLRGARESFLVRRTLAAWTLGMTAVGLAEALTLPFVREELRQPESVFGLFGALIGGGMALGALIASLWEPPLSGAGLLAAAGAVSTTALAVFAAGRSVLLCGAALVVGGAGMIWVHVAATTVLQVELPEEARAGTLGLTHTIQAAGLLLGLALAGDLANRWGIRATLQGAVVLLLTATALAAATAWQWRAHRKA